MKIFYLRNNVLGTGEVRTENGGRDIVPPEGYRLVEIIMRFSSKVCAVKENDQRYTLTHLRCETVDLTKVIWTQAATALAGCEKPDPAQDRNTETQKKESGRQTLMSVLPLKKHVSLNHGSGDFEKNFKTLIREQGNGADSLLTAKFLVYSMPPGDKAELNKNLLSNGLKNTGDLERLLAKWRSEALLANHGHKRSVPHSRTLQAGMER
jgi:hypothetical protein